MKRIIGIVANVDEKRYLLNKAYCGSIIEAGGMPVIIPYNVESFDILNMIDGLVFSGGGDIHSKFFNQPLDNRAEQIFIERDEFEISICKDAIKKNIPLLCICRGMQLLNVACGGSLIQHIDGHMQNEERHISTHKVIIEKNSLLYDIFKIDNLYVNSFHHQAIAILGKGLIVSARSSCGIIEAVEYTDKRFIVGVQWHPEAYTGYLAGQMLLFKRFIKEC